MERANSRSASAPQLTGISSSLLDVQEGLAQLGVLVRDLLSLLLLEDGPEREQQCGDEGERDLQHGSDTNPRPGAPTTA